MNQCSGKKKHKKAYSISIRKNVPCEYFPEDVNVPNQHLIFILNFNSNLIFFVPRLL